MLTGATADAAHRRAGNNRGASSRKSAECMWLRASTRMPWAKAMVREPLRTRATRFGAPARIFWESLLRACGLREEVAETVANGAAQLFKGRILRRGLQVSTKHSPVSRWTAAHSPKGWYHCRLVPFLRWTPLKFACRGETTLSPDSTEARHPAATFED
jgi:hypothetical protein